MAHPSQTNFFGGERGKQCGGERGKQCGGGGGGKGGDPPQNPLRLNLDCGVLVNSKAYQSDMLLIMKQCRPDAVTWPAGCWKWFCD